MTDDETGLDAVSPETHPAKSPADLWIENKALTKRVTNAEAHAQREQTLRIALTTRVGELQEERDRLQALLAQREGEREQEVNDSNAGFSDLLNRNIALRRGLRALIDDPVYVLTEDKDFGPFIKTEDALDLLDPGQPE